MPRPYGSKPRDKSFLFRMTTDQDKYVRDCAVKWEVGINAALSNIIDDAMQRDRYEDLMAARKERARLEEEEEERAEQEATRARHRAKKEAEAATPTRPTRRERGLKPPRMLPPPPGGFRAPTDTKGTP